LNVRAYVRKPETNYSYSLARFSIGVIDPNTKEICKHVVNILDSDRDVLAEGEFEKGDYVIVCEVDWAQNFMRHLVLSCYGP
jgi:hypothetical protein